MLQLSAELPKRTQLQDLILTLVKTVELDLGAWSVEYRKLLKQLLLHEVRLAELAKDYAVAHKPLTDEEALVVANPSGWHYDQRLEVSHTHADDGPGVQFAFGREIVFAPAHDRVIVMATGRYWLSRNGTSAQYEDRLALSTDAHYFLDGRGLPLGEAVCKSIRTRLRDYLHEVVIR